MPQMLEHQRQFIQDRIGDLRKQTKDEKPDHSDAKHAALCPRFF